MSVLTATDNEHLARLNLALEKALARRGEALLAKTKEARELERARDAANARASEWADIAGRHGAECDRLRWLIARAASELAVVKVQRDALQALLAYERAKREEATR